MLDERKSRGKVGVTSVIMGFRIYYKTAKGINQNSSIYNFIQIYFDKVTLVKNLSMWE